MKRDTEIGAAENAGRAAITNWPGRPASSAGSSTSSRSVTTSCVSRSTLTTTKARAVGRFQAVEDGQGPGGRPGGRRRRDDDDRRRRDRQELVAHVDPDGAPRDAAPAADAAGHAELVPPGAELVRQPLAIAVLGAWPEVAAGHLGEPEVEAAVPGSLRDRLDPVEIRDLRDAGAEAGRAHECAVGAGEAAFGDLRPARALSGVDEPGRQPGGRDRIADLRASGWRRRHGRAASCASFAAGSASASSRCSPRRRAGSDDEPVVELRQGEVEPAGDLRARSPSRCRSRCSRASRTRRR